MKRLYVEKIILDSIIIELLKCYIIYTFNL
jgi:hypothetical protein